MLQQCLDVIGGKKINDVYLGTPAKFIQLHIASCPPSTSPGRDTTRTIITAFLCRLSRPATIMADDPVPTRAVPATSGRFCDTAESAGQELKTRLSKLDLTSNTSDLASSDLDHHKDILKAVMTKFEQDVRVVQHSTNAAMCV